jgi:hypothetical protein
VGGDGRKFNRVQAVFDITHARSPSGVRSQLYATSEMAVTPVRRYDKTNYLSTHF